VLRRRRREGEDQPVPSVQGDENGLAGQESSGPWDIADDYPQLERFDLGSLLIPIREQFDVQVSDVDELGAWAAVVSGESGMQLQAFAAPRTGGLWDEVRLEIAENVASSGGSCEESGGPFGVELQARVPIGQEGQQEPQLQPVRFIGYDGQRWFLRGVISGPAATDRALGGPFDELFADIVVVRGDYPAPQRQLLEIRLPEEAQRALEAQLAEEDPDWAMPDPFARGPEITETR
jgi:hypothetical protein